MAEFSRGAEDDESFFCSISDVSTIFGVKSGHVAHHTKCSLPVMDGCCRTPVIGLAGGDESSTTPEEERETGVAEAQAANMQTGIIHAKRFMVRIVRRFLHVVLKPVS